MGVEVYKLRQEGDIVKWTSKVQLWKGNTLMTAQLTPEDAERMVKEGIATRINEQAVIYTEAI